MVIVPVSDKSTRKEFLAVTHVIYRDDQNWISPLDKDIETTFDPNKNPFYEHGKCERWILKDSNNVTIGRVAAFINEKKAWQYPEPTGGLGFFECINDREAAFKLFDTATKWLQQQGMEAMIGPINFGETDSFWGLLVEGFTPPSYGMNYHPPYYYDFFTAYGFETEYEQITNFLAVRNPFPERFTKIATWVANKPGYTFEHFSKKKVGKYVDDLMEIYNDAWQNFENFVPIKRQTLLESFKKMETIMDEKLIWFAYINGEPASFVVIIPDANQMIKDFKGRLGLLEKLKFLYKRWVGVNRMRAVVMGTKTAYQKHGLESALFIKLKEYVLPLDQYDELELSWVGDFNDKMLAIHEATGATFGKRHLTMRKVFR